MKPDVVEIHLKKMVIVPEMIGTIVGVHNGKVFTQVEVKPEMIGHYLDEFSISSKQQKKDKPHVTIKVPCLFKPEYPLDSTSSSLSYDNSPQTLHLLFKFQFLFKSVEIILAAQCWKRGETNDNVICLMKCANFVEIMNFKKCNFVSNVAS